MSKPWVCKNRFENTGAAVANDCTRPMGSVHCNDAFPTPLQSLP